MARSGGSGGFLTGLVVGAAAGAALALLYTPRSARRAMELMRQRGIDVEALRRGALQGQRERLEHAAAEARRAAERTRDELRQRFNAARGSQDFE